MNNGIKIEKRLASWTIFFGLVLTFILLIACAETTTMTTPVKLPTSNWGGRYYFNYEPPESKAPASVKINMAVVNPDFADKTKVEKEYSKVFKGLTDSMTADFNRIILAKGMTVTGPFENINMMTYPEKQNANLTLMPVITLNSRTDMGKWVKREEGGAGSNGTVFLDGFILLEIRESLSSEKLWIKKIDVGQLSYSTSMIAEMKRQYDQNGNFTGYVTGATLYDGREDAMANLIKEIYPVIMKKCWDYINSEELLMLNEKAKEIRALKRY
jgi:hypothetical protein